MKIIKKLTFKINIFMGFVDRIYFKWLHFFWIVVYRYFG